MTAPARERPDPAGGVILVALCVLVLAVSLSSFWQVGMNAAIVSGYEIAFLVVYAIISRLSPGKAEIPRLNPLVMIAVAAWIASMTISVFLSPYDEVRTGPGIARYVQTLFHMVFFLAVRDFFGRYRISAHWVLLAIPASCIAVAIMAAYLALGLDRINADVKYDWFNDPPFNTHIRHTGYQVAAGVGVLIAFVAAEKPAPFNRAAIILALLALCTFLFWMGGRGSILSVVATAMILAGTLWFKGVGCRSLLIFFPLSIALALPLSEWLAVFQWNGVIDLAERTTKAIAARDLNQVGSGRIVVWRTTWESVQAHLLFGLGPNGVWFMPNRVYGVQPHSFLLQFLAEWGLVGGLLFLALLAQAFYRGVMTYIVRAGKDLDIAALSAGTMIAALTLHGLVDGTYYHPQPSFYLALGFAIWTLPRRFDAAPRPR